MWASCLLCFLYNHNSSNGSDAEAQSSVYTLVLEHITAEITSARLALLGAVALNPAWVNCLLTVWGAEGAGGIAGPLSFFLFFLSP